MILLDTNLLARMTDSADRHCAPSRSAVQKLVRAGEKLIVVPQNLFEFWAVATRRPGMPPGGQNGLGMTIEQAAQWVGFFRRRFALLPDRQDLADRWLTLVLARRIGGFKAHDARLVAAMESYGITRLLTFNGDDFKSFSITIMDPASV